MPERPRESEEERTAPAFPLAFSYERPLAYGVFRADWFVPPHGRVARVWYVFLLLLGVACADSDATDPIGLPEPNDPSPCTSQGDCRSDCSCASGSFCASDGTCAAQAVAGVECTQGIHCLSGVCASNATGDQEICHAAPGEPCTIDTCEFCEAMVDGVGWCPTLCEDGSDCLGGFDASRERDRSLSNNINDSECVASQLFPGKRVCRFQWGFGCAASGDLCADGYECESSSPNFERSLCEALPSAHGEPCQADSVCASSICGPSALCQLGEVGDPCEDGSDCGQIFCGPNGRCQAGDVGESCVDFSDCESSVCGPDETCSTGDVGVPCDTNANCKSPLVCAQGGTCAPPCSGDASGCSTFDNDLKTCESVIGCSVGACRNPSQGCVFLDRDECERFQPCELGSVFCSPRSCNEVPRDSCGTFGGRFSYCVWESDLCGGTPMPCANLSVGQCVSQPGCEVTSTR